MVRTAELGSTPSNWYVANWSGEGMIAENPNNPLNLVSGGLYQAPSAENNTTVYFSSGVSGAFTSQDGGRTWSDQTLPAYPDWFNKSSPVCNQLHLADTAIAFGPNDTVYYIDLSDGIGNVPGGCSVATANLGLYATVSTDGGSTWGTPVPIRGTTAGAFFDKPWVAVDPVTGEAYVVYNDDTNGTLNLQNSTDGGQHWSAPVSLAGGPTSGLGTEVVVDPYGGVDVLWMDESNADVTFVRSTDHGQTFSAPERIATALTTYSSSSPDAFRSFSLPAIGVDDYTGNAYTGDLYAVWQNGTGGSPGNPMVSLSRSTDNGTTWSVPIQVNSNPRLQDYQPSLAIGPDGTVTVVWYGVNPVSGAYRLIGSVSHNGGLSFDPQFNVSDTDSYPGTTALGLDWWIGDYTHTIADRTGARPLWTDARSNLGWYCTGTCLWGYVYNISFYTALIVNDSLGASVTANLSVAGTVPDLGVRAIGPGPTWQDWMVGQQYNLSAAPATQVGGLPYTFAYWYGNSSDRPLIFVNSTYLNGTVVGGDHLTACYVASSGSMCHSPGAPGVLDLTTQPPTASALLNGVPIPPANRSSPIPEWPGTYWVNASAPGYYDLNQTFVVSPGNVTRAAVVLTPVTGRLVGTVSPTSAVVALNGTPLVVAPNGSFEATLPPGIYSLTATSLHYFAYSTTSVAIRSGEDTNLRIVLVGFDGWINGTVTPATARLSVGGAIVPLAGDGTFSARLTPGTYWANASLPGWTSESSGPLVLGPFGSLETSLSLTEYTGYVGGLASPGNASLTFDGAPLQLVAGQFNVTTPPGTYWLNASAWGCDPLALQIPVAANDTIALAVVLNASNGWIRGTIDPVGASLRVDAVEIVVGSDGSFNISSAPGSHTITAQAPGYEDLARSITVQPGRAVALSLALSSTSASAPTALGAALPFVGLAAVLVAVGIGIVVWRRRRRPALTARAQQR